MTQAPIIKLEGITNEFGSQRIHDLLDLDIMQGEILGLVGGSGTGKSVLVNTILGLNVPKSGSVIFKDQDILQLSPRGKLAIQQSWGVLFQHGALFSGLTVSENIELPMHEHRKLSSHLIKELADVKLKLVGLPAEAGPKFPSQLSGGMIKRASLARALVLDPLILFLDEPTAGLDPISAAAFDELILHLKETLNLTVIIITHDLDSLVTICDRIAVLVDKKVIVEKLEALLKHDHPWIRNYFHGPRMRAALSTKANQGVG
jgi:phospholipid/cholesterol/gamma-HCH transport system ATP-binding protein